MIGGFFLISKALGLEGNPYLRFLNLIFVLIGIRQAVKTNVEVNNVTGYAKNAGVAFGTSIIGVLLSTLGVLIYIEFIDPEFLSTMNNSFLIGGDVSIFELLFTLVIEGIASSVVGSLIVMQFYKNHGKSEI
ncbi:Membrane protein [Polaribacter dokdonensis DSW-5]|nr:Membrane protein [Polaribacter dokdonensis DSW-5]